MCRGMFKTDGYLLTCNNGGVTKHCSGTPPTPAFRPAAGVVSTTPAAGYERRCEAINARLRRRRRTIDGRVSVTGGWERGRGGGAEWLLKSDR